jgi:hypothetical protein
VLASPERPRAHKAPQLGQEQEVPDALARPRQPDGGELGGDLRTGGVVAARQEGGELLEGAVDGRRVEVELAVAGRHRRLHLRRRQRQDPRQVLGDDEVPRRAQDVGADDAPAVQ